MDSNVKIGVIRVLTTQDEKFLNKHGRIIEEAYPSLEVISRCIEDQPEGIYDERTEKMAIPKILKLAPKLEAEDAKAIIVSCAADPGLRELRKTLKIPVIGAGSATASLALTYGDKVGTLTLTEETPAPMKRILGEHLVAESKPKEVKTTLDLVGEEGKARAYEAAGVLKRKGAEVIALSCTGYSTIGIAPELERRTGILVIDPIVASGLFAWHAATRLK